MAERSGGMGLGGRRLKLVGNFLDVGDHVRAVTRFTVFVQAFFPTLLPYSSTAKTGIIGPRASMLT